MKFNVASFDSMIRIVLALIIFALGIIFQSWLGLLGFIFLFTGIIGFCPIYALIGFSSRPTVVLEEVNAL